MKQLRLYLNEWQLRSHFSGCCQGYKHLFEMDLEELVLDHDALIEMRGFIQNDPDLEEEEVAHLLLDLIELEARASR